MPEGRCEQLVLFHLIAAVDLQRFKLAGGLSANIDITDGLQDTLRHDRALYIAAFDGSGGIEDVGFAKHPVIAQCASTDDEDCANQPQAASLQEESWKSQLPLPRRCCRLIMSCRCGFGFRAAVCRSHFRDFPPLTLFFCLDGDVSVFAASDSESKSVNSGDVNLGQVMILAFHIEDDQRLIRL